VVSSAAAPALLIGGWTVAAGLQPRPFNAVAGSLSALAAQGAADRWVMTLAFVTVGACDVITALALRPAALPGRQILIAGAIAGMLVAASPEPAAGGAPLPHRFWAAAGFVALAAWPVAVLSCSLSRPRDQKPAAGPTVRAAGAWQRHSLAERGEDVVETLEEQVGVFALEDEGGPDL
jgi:hypothetical protein